MNDDAQYIEKWIVVINDETYFLDKKQAEILREAIKSGSRGMILFGDFMINIPFIEEFYLEERKLIQEPVYFLGTPEPVVIKPKTEEEIAQDKEYNKLLVERSKLVARGYKTSEIREMERKNRITPQEEQARRKMLLEQGKKLMEANK